MLRADDIIVVDADALIAVFDPADAHFQTALSILHQIDIVGATLLYPSTAIAEAVTTFQRKLHNQQAVTHIIQRIKQKEFQVEAVDQVILDEAALIFDPNGSKKNTLFDAIVATIAKRHHATTIFSFDRWYKNIGLTLVREHL